MPSDEHGRPLQLDVSHDAYDPHDERRREALFCLGNGFLSVRDASIGSAAGDHHYPGVYRAGLYDRQESLVDGERVENESLVNLPNWLPLSFRPAGAASWFSLDDGEILRYRHGLRLADAVSRRDIVFRDSDGRRTRLVEERLVSMADRHFAALRLEITPEDWSGEVEIRSGLEADVINDGVHRYSRYERRHLSFVTAEAAAPGLLFVETRTRQSNVAIVVAARTRFDDDCEARRIVRAGQGIAEHVIAKVERNRPFRIEKTAAIVTSLETSGGLRERALSMVESAPDYAMLHEKHAEAWKDLWNTASIEIADPNLSLMTRFHIFHVLQTFSPNSVDLDVGFPARGWQEAYHGQIFWDEILVFPFLNLRFPELARAALLYRCRRLDAARRAAREAGRRGAMFPWRSASDGREVTPTFQFMPLSGRWTRDHTYLQRHIGAAIAFNIWQYVVATDDQDFLSRHGAEMILEIARFWASAAERDPETGRFVIRGVVGPDEFHTAYPQSRRPGLDNNAYTNLMAAWTLQHAGIVFDQLPEARRSALRRDLNLTDQEFDVWDEVSRHIFIPLHDNLVSQFEGFEALAPCDLEWIRETGERNRVDWALEAAGKSVNDFQVVKQADFLMALYLLPLDDALALFKRCGRPVSPEQLRRTAACILEWTSHDSSLSRIAAAGALAELDLDVSWDCYRHALTPELDPINRLSSKEGVHLGAMASTVDVLQRRYLGLTILPDGLAVTPALPAQLGAVRLPFRCRFGSFALDWSGTRLRLAADGRNAGEVCVRHHCGVSGLRPGATLIIPPDSSSSVPR